MTVPIILTVTGVPYPQGNKSAVVVGGRARVIEGNNNEARAKHRSWRDAVRVAAQQYAADHAAAPLGGPVSLRVWFRFAPPRSDPHRTRHTTRPDLSKLLRATEDALVDGGLLRDDCLVWAITAHKSYTAHAPGAYIVITDDSEAEANDRAEAKARALADRKAARAAAKAAS